MQNTILIVDDDHGYRLSVGRHLRSLGHTILEAGTSEEALAILSRHDLNLVVLEVGLGAQSALSRIVPSSLPRGSDGYDLLKILRGSLADVPIIVLTHLDRDLDELACIREGADTFLRKPVDTVLLAEYVRSNLRRSQSRSRVEFNESPQLSSRQLHHQASEEED